MVAVALLVIVGGIAFFVSTLARRGDVQVRLGDDYFNAGDASDIADDIADRGPILFSDLAGGSRDMVLNHLSDEPEEGWVAFEARLPGDDRSCQVTWVADAGHFTYTCDESLTFPPDGTGLAALPVSITNGRIIVDINAAQRTSTTSGPPQSTVVVSGS